MSKFIAHFPLNVLVFPGEKMRLHIFEPRYKQLVNECLALEKSFGIPFVANSKLMSVGSEVRVSKVITKYANGEMDIEIEGIRMFYLSDFQDPFVGKLYAGGNVDFIENPSIVEDSALINFFISFYASFYGKNLSNSAVENLRSFDLARLLGFNNNQKYELIEQKSNRARHAFFMHQMRFLLLVKEQEKKLNNNFLLN
jgi:ATP-dependent Lon protease